MTDVYFGSFPNAEGMLHSFEAHKNSLEGYEVLFAAYGGRSYEGKAIVVYRKGDELYEVGGSHCSCNGLEGQWTPALINREYLRKRPDLDSDEFEPDAIKAFSELCKPLSEEDNKRLENQAILVANVVTLSPSDTSVDELEEALRGHRSEILEADTFRPLALHVYNLMQAAFKAGHAHAVSESQDN